MTRERRKKQNSRSADKSMGDALGGETGDVFVISDKDLKTRVKWGGGSQTRDEVCLVMGGRWAKMCCRLCQAEGAPRVVLAQA